MARLQLPAAHGCKHRQIEGDEALRALRAMGVDCGAWPRHTGPVSSAPQLTYARELLALQRRHGSRRIERVRPRATTPMHADEQQARDELCVVLEGRLHVGLHTPEGPGSLSLEAGEWVALPPNLPRTLFARSEPGLEMLRLHAPSDTRPRVA